MTMKYINTVTNEYPLTERQIRDAHPNTSFPEVFVAPEGYAPVHPAPMPQFNPYIEIASDGAPELVDGVWTQVWAVQSLSEERANENLSVAREQRWRQIQAIRDRRIQLGFECEGHWFHSDANSKIQHLANKDTARDMRETIADWNRPLLDPTTGTGIVWKTMSGGFVPLTIAMAYGIVAASKASEFSTFGRAEMLRAAVNSSSDPHSIDIAAGWPPVYEE